MYRPRPIHTICVLVLGVLAGSCSTYEVRDAYTPIANGPGYVEFKQDDVELRIGIKPDTRFYSIGILGAPMIPTYIKASDSKTIPMEIRLTLRHDRDFSFARRPCLSAESNDALCPDELLVTAVAMSRDDGSMYTDKQRRWRRIPNFYQANERTLNPPVTNDSTRINREVIYQHYGYVGEPEFGYLQVSVRYTYKCSGTCPKRLTLKTADLVNLHSWTVPGRTIEFERTRQSDYRPLTIVQ
jgi:hypothetical protein